MKVTHLINNHIFFFFFILSIILSTIHQINCAEYTVGDDDKWSSGINYIGGWAQKYNFTVGDVLDFDYVPGQHNVFEVTEATYKSCNSSTGVLKRYESGNDKIELTDARKYWFICDIIDHCRGGMKFGVDVMQLGFNTAPIPVVTPPPPAAGNSGSKLMQGNPIFLGFLLLFWGSLF
ncbi:hypothetical protein ACHQM5_022502 [Ranunculus cassubicifolius]